jgi:hypothetical protein
MRLDEENFTREAPRGGEILLGVLTLPLQVFQLVSEVFRKVTTQPRVANEGIDVRPDERWGCHAAPPPASLR